jgi:hypothetical protein
MHKIEGKIPTNPLHKRPKDIPEKVSFRPFPFPKQAVYKKNSGRITCLTGPGLLHIIETGRNQNQNRNQGRKIKRG